jgi:ribose 1,5-bisphosphokinase PhnN
MVIDMSQSTMTQLEERFSQLPVSEQKVLLERLARRVNANGDNGNENLLAQMAADPDIQREISEIEKEFASADTDGLT